MTKTELIEALAKQSEVSKRVAEDMLDNLVDIIIDNLKKGEKVAVTGFGTFNLSHRKARSGVNPQNPSEKIEIPAMDIPKFTAGKSFKDAFRPRSE